MMDNMTPKMREKLMKKEDAMAQRRDFISDLHISFRQSEIEIIKSFFALSLASLAFNLTVLESSENIFDIATALLLLSSIIFVAIIVLSFILFRTVRLIRSRWMELLQEEDNEDTSTIERMIKKSNHLIFSCYILFLVSVMCIFLRTLVKLIG